MTQIHKLKTLKMFWDAVSRGDKTFEVRLNDRAFQTGDILELEMVDGQGRYVNEAGGNFYSKRVIRKRISYMLQGGQYGIDPKYCVLGLAEVDA